MLFRSQGQCGTGEAGLEHRHSGRKKLFGCGEVILGHHVAGDEGDELTFFKKGFPVAGRLEQTGMGFDATVFMTRGTLTALAREAERILKHPLTRDGSLISTVMIKLAPGYDSVKAARALRKVKYSS